MPAQALPAFRVMRLPLRQVRGVTRHALPKAGLEHEG
jgi:hypothetical protein